MRVVVLLVVLDRLIKQEAPGSLIEPAITHLLPQRWSTIPLALGLFMSPWGGRAVFPSIYRDMGQPEKYGKALRITYGFTVSISSALVPASLMPNAISHREWNWCCRPPHVRRRD